MCRYRMLTAARTGAIKFEHDFVAMMHDVFDKLFCVLSVHGREGGEGSLKRMTLIRLHGTLVGQTRRRKPVP